MPVMTYTARTLNGKEVEGRVTSDSIQALRNRLSAKGLDPLDIRVLEGDDAAAGWNVDISGMFRRVSKSELRWVTGQLALMINAGTTIAEALDALVEQLEGKMMGDLLRNVSARVTSGSNLSDALKQHETVFNTFYISAIRSGEATGDLGQVFNRLEEHLKKRERLVSTIRTAMIYPTVLVFIGVFAMIVMLTFVIPKFIVVFQNFGADLPMATRLLIGLADLVKTNWYVIPISIVVPIVATIIVLNQPILKTALDTWVLRLPVFGSLTRVVQSSALLRTLNMLLEAGVPIVESLDVARDACTNQVFRKTVDSIKTGVLQGQTFSENVNSSTLFSASTKQMISTGERSGELGSVMGKLADHLDEEIDKSFARVSALAEPAIIVVMGAAVGFMAIALLSPLFQLTSIVKGG